MKKHSVINLFLIPFCYLIFIYFYQYRLVQMGLALQHGDAAAEILVAQDFNRGIFSAFKFDLPYSGNLPIFFRALWVRLYELFWGVAPEISFRGQILFTYVISPWLLTLALWTMVKQCVDPRAGLIVGAFSCFVLPFLNLHFSTGGYIFTLAGGVILLTFLSRYENPLLELPIKHLFGWALFCGLMYYTYRSFTLFCVSAFLPFSLFKKELILLLTGQRCWEKRIVKISAFFFLLFLYLEFFGPGLGTFRNRPIRIHAHPNLQISVGLLFLLWIVNRIKSKKDFHFERLFIFGFGFLIGLVPEIYHWVTTHALPPGDTYRNRNPGDFITVLGQVPRTLQEMFGGEFYVTQLAPMILLIISLVSLYSWIRKNRRGSSFGVLAALSVFAYCRLHTYTGAPARYLIPFIPLPFLGMGLFISNVRSRIKSNFNFKIAVGALFTVTALHSTLSNRALVINLAESNRVAQVNEVLLIFSQNQIHSAYSDDYWWHSNTYTAYSKGSLVVVPHPSMLLTPPLAKAQLESERRVGFILTHNQTIDSTNQDRKLSWLNHSYRLHWIRTVGDRDLWIGDKI